MPARSSLVANEPQVLSTERLELFKQPVNQSLDTPAQSQKNLLWQLPPVISHFLFFSLNGRASAFYGRCCRACGVCSVALSALWRSATIRLSVAGCQRTHSFLTMHIKEELPFKANIKSTAK